jgi:PAS domain S-box-containing protein
MVVGVLLALELLFVGTLAGLLREAEKSAAREAKSKLIVGRTNHIFQLLYDAGKAAQDYQALRGDPEAAQRFRDFGPQVVEEVHALAGLVHDQPRYEPLVRDVDINSSKIIKLINYMIDMAENGRQLEALAMARKSRPIYDRLKLALITDLRMLMQEQEKIIAESPAQQARARDRVQMILWFGLACNVALAIGMGLFFVRGITGRLDVLVSNANQLARGAPLAPPLPGADEISHLDHVFHDMAKALEEAARKERAMIENARDMICSIDADGLFVKVSPASEQMLGYPPAELIGHHFSELVCPDDVKATGQIIRDIISGQPDVPIENRVTCKDGSIIHVLWSVHWSQSERALFCVVHDITERKKLERMKQEFVAMISHDLRTPLTSVRGFLSMLEKGVYGQLNDVGGQRTTAAERNVARLISLINDLLDIEKLESGTLDINPEVMDLSDVVARTVDAVKVYAEQHNVKLKADRMPYEIFADGDRLVQVLVNLVSNAVKFSPPESTVEIAAGEVGDYLEVKVIDQGRGVPEKFRQTIFDRFRQVEAADATKKGGTGLGLAICKAIVEQHGGTIGVDSEEGKGSTFWFRIPKSAPERTTGVPAGVELSG